jgi:hypothetical protein
MVTGLYNDLSTLCEAIKSSKGNNWMITEHNTKDSGKTDILACKQDKKLASLLDTSVSLPVQIMVKMSKHFSHCPY